MDNDNLLTFALISP